MFNPSKATTVAAYIAAVPADRKETILKLHALIQKTVPKLKSHFAYNMLAYGSFEGRNHKKEIINWPIIALANQKNYISLYVCSVDAGQYIAEKYKNELGKVSVGKSCIRFKTIENIDLTVLKKVLLAAAKNPGLEGY